MPTRIRHSLQRFATGPRSGAALLLVLGFVVLLSVLTIGILQNTQREILRQAEDYARPQLEIAANSATESALAVISNFQNIDGGIYAPQQGWEYALTLAGFEYIPAENAWRFDEKTLISVSFFDESSRFPLNKLSENELEDLFIALGISASDAANLSACLADWIDSDDNARTNGAEIDDYESLGNEYIPPNRELTELRELRYIKNFREIFFDDSGNPNSLFRRLEEAVSLFASAGKPNINTASDATLDILCYDTDANKNSLTDYRREENKLDAGGNVFRNANELSRVGAESLANKVGFSVRTLRITATARRGAASFILETKVEISTSRSSSNSIPFKLIERKENAVSN